MSGLVRAYHDGEEHEDVVVKFHTLDWATDEIFQSFDEARAMSIEDCDEFLAGCLLASVEARNVRGFVAPSSQLLEAMSTFCDQFNVTVESRDEGLVAACDGLAQTGESGCE